MQSATNYTYSDWFKSNTTSFIWAQYTKNDGSVQYVFLKEVPASATWNQSSVTMTTPEDAVSVSLYHVIAGNGSITLDDVSLSKNTPCPTAPTGSITNGGFEDECDTAQFSNGWNTAQYGTTTAQFSVATDTIHTGSKSAQFSNADAGAEVGLNTTVSSPQSSHRYLLSFWHADTTYIYAYVAFTLNDGTVQYKSLMSAPSTVGEWSQYTDGFTTPANTQSLQITIATSGAGTVHVDDVSLTPQPTLSPKDFSTPMVSITFDDGAQSTYQNTLSSLNTYGYKPTLYLNAGSLNTTGFMTSKQVKTAATQGYEIGSHLYHHSDIALIDTATLQSELQGNKTSLQSIVGSTHPISSFASPYGSYTSNKIDTVMNYESSHRTTDGTLNTKDNLNARQIHGRLVTASTTIDDFKAWIAEAKATKAWLVLVYHNVATSSAGQSSDVAPYNVTPSNFSQQMSIIHQNAIPVRTVQSALTTLSAQ